MKVKLSRWGNCLAVRIPAEIAREASLQEGQSVAVDYDGESVRLTPPPASVPTLASLLDQITDDNIHEEADFGAPVGNESW